MTIPVATLWLRWKLSPPRRGGKRSISIQLEKMEVKKSSKATSSSSSTPDTDSKTTSSKISGGNKEPQPPSRGRVLLDRPNESKPGNINITNNVTINGRRQDHHVNQVQRIDEPAPMSPRIALESLHPNHPARLPQNQPWMHQDQNGRWVPRDESYLHPGLPPPPQLRTRGSDIGPVDQGEDARRERLYVPGGRRH